MNQFLIENPVLCIVIAFIIGAVIMNITSAITVRMAVEKEVERALGEEEEEEETRESWNEGDFGAAAFISLTVFLGVDEDGCRCLYLAKPDRYKKGEGPLADLGHDYYYHPTLQFLIDDFDLDKLAELGINIRPGKEYVSMELVPFVIKGENVLKFLEEAFNACGKAILRRE